MHYVALAPSRTSSYSLRNTLTVPCSPSTMRFAMSHGAPSLTMAAFSRLRLLIATRADGGTHTECLLFAHVQQIDAHRSVVTDDNDHQVSSIAGTTYDPITRPAPGSTSERSWQYVLTAPAKVATTEKVSFGRCARLRAGAAIGRPPGARVITADQGPHRARSTRARGSDISNGVTQFTSRV